MGLGDLPKMENKTFIPPSVFIHNRREERFYPTWEQPAHQGEIEEFIKKQAEVKHTTTGYLIDMLISPLNNNLEQLKTANRKEIIQMGKNICDYLEGPRIFRDWDSSNSSFANDRCKFYTNEELRLYVQHMIEYKKTDHIDYSQRVYIKQNAVVKSYY